MFCSRCGKENADSASFCMGCGCSLNNTAPQIAGKKLFNNIPMLLTGIIGAVVSFGMLPINDSLQYSGNAQALDRTLYKICHQSYTAAYFFLFICIACAALAITSIILKCKKIQVNEELQKKLNFIPMITVIVLTILSSIPAIRLMLY